MHSTSFTRINKYDVAATHTEAYTYKGNTYVHNKQRESVARERFAFEYGQIEMSCERHGTVPNEIIFRSDRRKTSFSTHHQKLRNQFEGRGNDAKIFSLFNFFVTECDFKG